MKRLARIISFFLVMSITSAGLANPNRIQETLDHLKTALNQHDFEMLAPFLAEDFTFNGYTGDMGRSIMRQIVTQYPETIQSIVIQEVVEVPPHVQVKTSFLFGAETESHTITMTDDYRIVQAPIVQIQMAGSSGNHGSYQPDGLLPDDKIPASMVSPFELAGRLIVVEAEISGVRGNFLVDSGAPGFVLNAIRFPNLASQAQPVGHSTYGAGGAVEGAEWVEASQFKWQGAELASVKAMFLDLTHLERNTNTQLVGVIGVDFLKNFTVLFDYSNRELTLVKESSLELWQTAPDRVIPFTMIAHIPVIEVKIGDHDFRFGIDCGAEGAMLFTKWEAVLKPHYEFLRNDVLNGADKNSQMSNVVRLDSFQTDGVTYEGHTFHLNDLDFGHDVEMDGLLGYEFLSEHKTAIDYPNRMLYVWANAGALSKTSSSMGTNLEHR